MPEMRFVLYLVVLVSGDQLVKTHDLLPTILNYYSKKHITTINGYLCHIRDGKNLYKATRNNLGGNRTYMGKYNVLQSFPWTSMATTMMAQHHVIGIIVDLRCQTSRDFLKIVSHTHLFNGSYAYSIMSDDSLETTVKLLEPLNIAFDSSVVVFLNNTMYDIYRTSSDTPLVSTEIGHWDYDGVLTFLNVPRWNLGGSNLKASTVIKELDMKLVGTTTYFYNELFHAEVDVLSRYACKMNTYLEYLYNFTTTISITPDWGYFDFKKGSFDKHSMYGELERELVDFGLSMSRMFSRRLLVAYLTQPTQVSKTSVMFRHPPASASYDGFARPFNSTTWLMTFLFIFVGSICLSIMRQWIANDDPPDDKDYSGSLLHVVAVLCLQGCYIESMNLPIRVLSIFLQIFALMVYSYYGATVVGFLLSPSPRTLTTVEKLVDSRMDLWTENISFHINHFRENVGARATRYYELGIKGKTRDKDKFVERKKGLKMMKKGGMAMYGMNSNMYGIIEKTFTSSEICSLYVMDMLAIPTCVAIRKRSPYREIYTRGLQRFIESGFKEYENQKWFPQRPVCVGSEATEAVKLEATLIAQLIFTIGFVISLTFFILERCIPPYKLISYKQRCRMLSCKQL